MSFFPFGNLLFILNRFQRSLDFSGRSHEFKNKLKYTSYGFSRGCHLELSEVVKTLVFTCLAAYLRNKLIWLKMDILPPLEFSNVVKLSVMSHVRLLIL